MVDLRTRFAGIELKNPLVISSAGITETVDKMRRCQEFGAAAVVMKSWFEEEVCRQDPSPRYKILRHDMGRDRTFSFFSYEQASEWDLDRYAEEVSAATGELDMAVIPSINGITDEGWVSAARRMVEAGAVAIELNTSCPHGSITFRGGAVEQIIGETVRKVRRAVEVPLIAKISPMLTSPMALVKHLGDVGVDGFTIFNRMTGLDVDLESEAPIMHGGYGGHGGPWAIQYPLRWISDITRQMPGVQIAGSGGVMDGRDLAKYILAGAQVVQVCTAVVLNGYEIIADILGELSRWMDGKGHADLASLRGRAAQKVLGTAEVERGRRFTAYIHPESHAPCVHACPARVPAQAYVHRIAQRDFAGALEAVRSANPFQSVCAWACYHPCEAACTRGDVDEPIAIRALKRFAVEWGRRNAPLSEVPIETAPPTGKKVAVVGAGPAGLTAAHDLARLGHAVTVLEASSAPGGMLRWTIPAHRLPRGIVDEEIDYIRRFGVEIRCGERLGRDFTLDDLTCGGYHAVVLALGAGQSARLGVPDEDSAGVVGAMQFLRRAGCGEDCDVGRRVAVIGGGNSALDAARCAVRRGAEETYLVYRRTRDEMPATAEELDLAEQEGVRVLYLAMPVRVNAVGGRVTGITIRGGYLDRPRAGERRRPVPLDDIEYTLAVDQVVVAVSQLADAAPLGAAGGVRVSSKGTVEVLDEFGTTSRRDVFAAGDLTGRAGSIVEAVASGRRTALAVDSFLGGKEVEDARRRWGDSVAVDGHEVLKRTISREPAPRVEVPQRDAEQRARDFEPVELCLSEEEAVREAERCLRCGCGIGCELCYRVCPYSAVKPDGYTFRVDEELCIGCGLCIERCPNDNIDAVELDTADEPPDR